MRQTTGHYHKFKNLKFNFSIRLNSTSATKNSFSVTAIDDGMRLDRFLLNELKVPQALIAKLIRQKKVNISPEVQEDILINLRIKKGQKITVNSNVTVEPKTVPEKLSPKFLNKVRSWILYQDEHIIVLNKPSGLVVQGSHDSLVQMLPALQFDSPYIPFLVHRLDKQTSGCLIIARNRKIAEILANGFKSQKIKKLYWAIVAGNPVKMRGVMRAPLSEKFDENFVYVDEEKGDESTTGYTVLDSVGNHPGNKFSILALKAFTGRKHQLRVHCASVLQTPILGDTKYGTGIPSSLEHLEVKGLQLHAREMQLVHPMTQKLVNFVAPLPVHIKDAIESLAFEVNYKSLEPTINNLQ